MENILEKIKIIHEDKDIVVINKPAGLVVHSDGKTNEPTVVDWVLKNYPENKEVGEPLTLSNGDVIWRPGIVHRIDRETSGILIIAKNQKSYLYLKSLFQNHEMNKTYHLFVYGKIKEDKGTINRPISRSKNDFRMWSATRGGRGEEREAITDFEVLGRSEDITFVEAKPKTGRTHQIRVHFKAINHPLVADKLYAPKREPVLGFQRMALHAIAIEFKDINGKDVKFETPYPEDFEKAIDLFNSIKLG